MSLRRLTTPLRSAMLLAVLPLCAGLAVGAADVSLQFAPGYTAADAAIPNHTFHVQLVGSGTDFTNPCVAADLKLTLDRAKVDITGTGTPAALFPFTPALSPLAGTLPAGTSPSNYRHVSVADLGGTVTHGLPSIPASPVLADIAITTSASPAAPFTIAISKNDRTPRQVNDALLFQDNANYAVLKPSAEPTYTNTNGTGLGAADKDGDGVIDSLEYLTVTAGTGVVLPAGQLNGYLSDSDGDGMSDAAEVNYATAGANLYDYTYTAGLDTNPRNRDTDADTWPDGMEARNPSVFPNGPLVADTVANGDGDALPDALDPASAVSEVDHDLDRVLDAYEVSFGFSASSNTSFPQLGNVKGVDGTVAEPLPPSSGYINFVDVTALNQFRLGTNPTAMDNPSRADINRDGLVNFVDVSSLNNFRLGTKATLP